MLDKPMPFREQDPLHRNPPPGKRSLIQGHGLPQIKHREKEKSIFEVEHSGVKGATETELRKAFKRVQQEKVYMDSKEREGVAHEMVEEFGPSVDAKDEKHFKEELKHERSMAETQAERLDAGHKLKLIEEAKKNSRK